jgi:hypothetical protein
MQIPAQNRCAHQTLVKVRPWLYCLLVLALAFLPLAGVMSATAQASASIHECCKGGRSTAAVPVHCHEAETAQDSRCNGDCNGTCAGCQSCAVVTLPVVAVGASLDLPRSVFGRSLPPALIAFFPRVEPEPPRLFV